MAATTAPAGSSIVLERPEQFHEWMATTKGSVPRDLWRYFDPDTAHNYNEPEPVTYNTVRPGAQT